VVVERSVSLSGGDHIEVKPFGSPRIGEREIFLERLQCQIHHADML
jgi:hypothetical protein